MPARRGSIPRGTPAVNESSLWLLNARRQDPWRARILASTEHGPLVHVSDTTPVPDGHATLHAELSGKLSRARVRRRGTDSSCANVTDLTQRRHAPNRREDLSGLIGEEQTSAQLLARHTDGAHLQEAPGGFEPPIRVLQTRALPLGYGARSPKRRAVYHAA